MFFFFRSIPSINLKKSRCSTFVKKCPRLQKVSCKKWQGVWQACRRRHVAISRPHISTNKHARVYRFYKNSSSASTTMHVLAMWNAQGCVCVCLRVLQCVFRFLFESVENPLEVILCLFVWEWFCVCWRVLCNTWECFSRVLRENSRVLVRLQLSVSQKIESEVESFSVFCERELESASESARVYTHCTTLPHTVTHCNTLQHTATHCNTLQHTATHCRARECWWECLYWPLSLFNAYKLPTKLLCRPYLQVNLRKISFQMQNCRYAHKWDIGGYVHKRDMGGYVHFTSCAYPPMSHDTGGYVNEANALCVWDFSTCNIAGMRIAARDES